MKVLFKGSSRKLTAAGSCETIDAFATTGLVAGGKPTNNKPVNKQKTGKMTASLTMLLPLFAWARKSIGCCNYREGFLCGLNILRLKLVNHSHLLSHGLMTFL